ncbi:zinc ribbon domain-containing protein [Methanobrevibacter sp. V14]|uniref:zinc ribbon domain-containing protein n=1 Tax=Methanobrevibacter sp. V14 TaxID=3064280 RepID=UPI002733FC4C|nr:zinc ribbon domain-containing protein [Methanobrevibacter sp. V14]
MVKCPRCGYENSSTAVYCDNCTYLLSDSDGNKIKNTKRESSWNMSIGKKIVIVLGIIVIAFLLFSFVYNSTQPSNQDSLNIVSDDGSNHQTSSYPYKAVIQYGGSWYAEMGDPNYLVKESGYGNKRFTLDCAAWERVSLDVQKQDYGEGELKVQLLRNGEVVAENSTTQSNGRIVINYNY